jgi:hypothetical protein
MKSESYGIYMPVLFGQGKRLGIAELKPLQINCRFSEKLWLTGQR